LYCVQEKGGRDAVDARGRKDEKTKKSEGTVKGARSGKSDVRKQEKGRVQSGRKKTAEGVGGLVHQKRGNGREQAVNKKKTYN